MTERLTDEERQELLHAIDGRLINAHTSDEEKRLLAVRRKLEGTDKIVTVETATMGPDEVGSRLAVAFIESAIRFLEQAPEHRQIGHACVELEKAKAMLER